MNSKTKDLLDIKMKSKLKFFGTPSLALALLLAGCGKEEVKVATQGPSTVPVVIAVAVQKDIPISIRSIGNVQAYQSVAIKSQVNGQITEVHFKQGQDVNKGDLLFVLDPRQTEADLR